MVACVQGMHMAFGHVRDGLHDVAMSWGDQPSQRHRRMQIKWTVTQGHDDQRAVRK